MKKVLIDTNIYSFAMMGDVNVVNALKRIDVIGFSAISIGELFSGFKGGKREARNREELNLFLDSPRVVVHPIDGSTADFYASIL
jgi:tRNA(fMet)-specific endonuclease VapC